MVAAKKLTWFTAASLRKAKRWRQPKCPSVEYYSAMKKDRVPVPAATWMDMENIIKDAGLRGRRVL